MKYRVEQFIDGYWSTVEWGLTLKAALRMSAECGPWWRARVVPDA